MADKNESSAEAKAEQPATGSSAAAGEQNADERQTLRARAIEAERKAAKLEAEIEKSKQEKLKEQGQWQKLAEDREAELRTHKAALRKERIERAIFSVAAKANAADPEDIVRFVAVPDEMDGSDSEALLGHISDTIGALAKSKPYLFASPDTKTNKANTRGAAPGSGASSFDPSKVTKKSMWGLTLEQMQKVRDGRS